MAVATNCYAAPFYGAGVTLYLGPLEVRDWKSTGTATTPSPLYATALHFDALGTVRAVTGFSTDATKQGKMTERSVFRPYGQAVPFDKDITTPNESKGFIGERYDGDAGLKYLNARYYDPKLAMFIQPDWWEVTKAGVGTNRYSYSFNDPVNKMDRTGHATCGSTLSGASCDKALKGAERDRNDLITHAKKAKTAIDRIKSGAGFYLTSGLMGFKTRFERSYGTMTIAGLEIYAKNAMTVAAGIGVAGQGVNIESYEQAESSIRAANPTFGDKQVDGEMAKIFGARSFKNPKGQNTSFTGRDKRAAAWAVPGANEIGLDAGYDQQSGVFAHEGAHAFLSQDDHHSLNNDGYGVSGIADALKAGVAWDHAESFACVLGRC